MSTAPYLPPQQYEHASTLEAKSANPASEILTKVLINAAKNREGILIASAEKSLFDTEESVHGGGGMSDNG